MENVRTRLTPLIPDIVKRELTNREAARRLGVSEHHVCRVLKEMGVQREAAPDRKGHSALVKARKDLRTSLANDKSLTIEAAAARANCSVRTLYRYRTKA